MLYTTMDENGMLRVQPTQRPILNWCRKPERESGLDVCRHRQLSPPKGEQAEQFLK